MLFGKDKGENVTSFGVNTDVKLILRTMQRKDKSRLYRFFYFVAGSWVFNSYHVMELTYLLLYSLHLLDAGSENKINQKNYYFEC